jgi:hypothetical protein
MNRHRALALCLGMISEQTFRVCREGKPLYTFPIMPSVPEAVDKTQKPPNKVLARSRRREIFPATGVWQSIHIAICAAVLRSGVAAI